MTQQVDYDLEINTFGPDVMGLFVKGSMDQIVTATRGELQWLIHAEGVDDVTVDTRAEAVDAMQTQALAILPADGYTILKPRGLKDIP